MMLLQSFIVSLRDEEQNNSYFTQNLHVFLLQLQSHTIPLSFMNQVHNTVVMFILDLIVLMHHPNIGEPVH